MFGGRWVLENISLKDLLIISLKTRDEILKIYESVFSVESKPDPSPLTLADKKSCEHIVNELQRLYLDPDIPVLSEEER